MNEGACGELLSERADDKLNMTGTERTQTERGYLSRLWERDRPQCGKRPSFDTALKISSLLSSAMEKFSMVPWGQTQKEGFCLQS